MTSAIFSQALSEYFRFRRVWPWLLLSLICCGLAASWKFFFPHAKPLDTYALVSTMLVYHLLALASAIFTTAIVSQEVEQRTIVYLLTRPVPRWRLLVTRYVASVIVVALLGAFGLSMTSLAAYGSLMSNPRLGGDVVALAIGSAAYGALFLFVSLLFNRALIICVLFAFGWETSVPLLPGDLYRMSIFSYLQAIADHPPLKTDAALAGLIGRAGEGVLTRQSSLLVLGLMIVGLLAASGWWFTHFEYVPREDAE